MNEIFLLIRLWRTHGKNILLPNGVKGRNASFFIFSSIVRYQNISIEISEHPWKTELACLFFLTTNELLLAHNVRCSLSAFNSLCRWIDFLARIHRDKSINPHEIVFTKYVFIASFTFCCLFISKFFFSFYIVYQYFILFLFMTFRNLPSNLPTKSEIDKIVIWMEWNEKVGCRHCGMKIEIWHYHAVHISSFWAISYLKPLSHQTCVRMLSTVAAFAFSMLFLK